MDDLISRTAAMTMPVLPKEHRDYISFELDDIYEQGWNECQKFITELPSADRPSGHWVLVNRGLDIYMCDRCGEILQIDSIPIWDYCPVCGARMGGETDGRPNQQTGGD